MDFLVWLVVGALIGWLASAVLRTDPGQGALLNVGVGVAGSLLGGWLLAPLFGVDTIRQGDFGISSLFVSFLGAILLLLTVNFSRRRARRKRARAGVVEADENVRDENLRIR